MSGNGPKMKTENIQVSIETCKHRIVGTVHPPSLAYRSRLSDLLNQRDISFLSVTEAEVYANNDAAELLYKTDFLSVNLSNIELIRPLEGS